MAGRASLAGMVVLLALGIGAAAARTGDVVHPAVVYLIDRDGRIAYAVNGDAEAIVELLRRL